MDDSGEVGKRVGLKFELGGLVPRVQLIKPGGGPRPAVVFPSYGIAHTEERASSNGHRPCTQLFGSKTRRMRRESIHRTGRTETDERKRRGGRENDEAYTASILDEGTSKEERKKERKEKEKEKEKKNEEAKISSDYQAL